MSFNFDELRFIANKYIYLIQQASANREDIKEKDRETTLFLQTLVKDGVQDIVASDPRGILMYIKAIDEKNFYSFILDKVKIKVDALIQSVGLNASFGKLSISTCANASVSRLGKIFETIGSVLPAALVESVVQYGYENGEELSYDIINRLEQEQKLSVFDNQQSKLVTVLDLRSYAEFLETIKCF